MSEEQKEMQVEAAEKAAKKVAPVTTAEPEENFDWDAYENDAVVPASEKDALTQKYAETLSKVGEKEVVEGTPSKPLPLSFVCRKYSRRRRTSG